MKQFKIKYENVLINQHVTTRESLESFFFPRGNNDDHSERTAACNNRQWSEGWWCLFGDHGLSLDVTTYRTAEQLAFADTYRAKFDLGPIESTEEKDHELSFEYDWAIVYSGEHAEDVRTAINIAQRWQEDSHDILGFQFHTEDGQSIYGIKFLRDTTDKDYELLEQIEDSLTQQGIIFSLVSAE